MKISFINLTGRWRISFSMSADDVDYIMRSERSAGEQKEGKKSFKCENFMKLIL
jgi:hypothetical protein